MLKNLWIGAWTLLVGIMCVLGGLGVWRHVVATSFAGLGTTSDMTVLPGTHKFWTPMEHTIVCPEAFKSGSDYCLVVRMCERTATAQELCDMPLRVNIHTEITMKCRTEGFALCDAPSDVRRLALANIPETRNLPEHVREQPVSDETLTIRTGIYALVLLFAGILLFIVGGIVLGIRAFRMYAMRTGAPLST